LVSLLSIDGEIVQLVGPSPACSELLPGPTCPSNDGTHNAPEIHGVLSLIESASQHGALRMGLAVACDDSVLSSNSFGLSTSPFMEYAGPVSVRTLFDSKSSLAYSMLAY
jgi:hypothetical protein